MPLDSGVDGAGADGATQDASEMDSTTDGQGGDGPSGDGSGSDDGSVVDGSVATDAPFDAAGPSDAGNDGTTPLTRTDAGADAESEASQESPTDNGYMEGGGCSCTTVVGGSTSPTGGWTLLALGLAVGAMRRKRG